jgi:hypothetical protein
MEALAEERMDQMEALAGAEVRMKAPAEEVRMDQREALAEEVRTDQREALAVDEEEEVRRDRSQAVET